MSIKSVFRAVGRLLEFPGVRPPALPEPLLDARFPAWVDDARKLGCRTPLACEAEGCIRPGLSCQEKTEREVHREMDARFPGGLPDMSELTQRIDRQEAAEKALSELGMYWDNNTKKWVGIDKDIIYKILQRSPDIYSMVIHRRI